MFYDYDRICSYNAIWNFILTNRGYGKSYGLKKKCIKNFLNKGKQFIYLRRYKTELKDNSKWFDDISKEFPNVKFKYEKNTFYINNKPAGFSVALSVSQKLKSVSYPNVTLIMFDEFIVDNSLGNRYLTNEVDACLDFYETVARTRNDVRMFFLGNNISLINPYFSYFNIKPNKNERFTLCRDGELIIDISTNKKFIEMKKDTKFGKLIRNTKYSDFSIDNQSLRDNETFIELMPLKWLDAWYSITYNNKMYTVYKNEYVDLFYISEKINKDVMNFSILATDHTESSLLKNKYLGNHYFNITIRYFLVGKIRFSNQEVKHNIYEIFKILGVK